MMTQEGNTKNDEAVHTLEMGFIRVQLLNLLKLTINRLHVLRNYWKNKITQAQAQL